MLNGLDLIVIVTYLVLVLVIGLISGRNIKTFKDYALGNLQFPSILVTMTISATLIGGGSSLGTATEVYKFGILVVLAKYGVSIGMTIIALFLVPRFNKFLGSITVGEIMGKMYGKEMQIITGISGSLLCVSRMASQVLAMGFVLELTLGIPLKMAIILGASIVILYSALGGLKGVVYTDTLQFITMAVTVPIALNLGLKAVGGYEELWNSLPEQKINPVYDMNMFLKYMFIFFYMQIPMLTPPFVQRILMVKDLNKVKRSFLNLAAIDLIFTSISGLIGLLAYKILPMSSNPNSVYLDLIYTVLPIGLRGMAIAGVLSIIMSTADSYINVVGISISNDVLKPLKKDITDRQKIVLSQIITIVTGALAVVIAMYFDNIFELALFTSNFWGPIVVAPLILGLFEIKITKNQCFLGIFFGMSTFLLWEFYNLKVITNVYSFVPAIFSNALIILLSKFLYGCFNGTIVCPKLISGQGINLTFPKNILSQKIQRHLCNLKEDAYDIGMDHTVLCIFLIISSIFPYLFWKDITSVELINLKFLSGVLCVLFLLKDLWPGFLKDYEAILWYSLLVISLGFLAIISAIITNYTIGSIIYLTLSLMLLGYLVSFRGFVFVFIVSCVFSFIFLMLSSQNNIFIQASNNDNFFWFLYVLLVALTIIYLFMRVRERKQLEKIETMKNLASIIVHELRTPLMTANSIINRLEINLKAKTQNKYVALNLTQKMGGILYQANLALEILLKNLSLKNFLGTPQKMNVNALIGEVIGELTLEDNNIKYNLKKENFITADSLLIKHVFYNIFKNALYFVKNRRNGMVEVESNQTTDYNIITIKDNGPGILKEDLSKLFIPFFTKKKQGVGLGLYFCMNVMRAIGGDIVCSSKVGEYTKFELYFPYRN